MSKTLVSIITTAFLLLATYSNAQDNSKHSVGMAAGFTTGYGPAYRYQTEKFGFQVTFAPYKSRDFQLYSFGGTLMYRISSSEKTSFYLYQGNHFLYQKSMQYVYDYSYQGSRREVVTTTYNTGLGVGFEVVALRKLGINFMFGYAGYDSFEHITVTSEIGLFYKL